MGYPVVVTLVFHSDDARSQRVSKKFVEHFNRLGMVRDGIHMRLPIRIRSDPFFPLGHSAFPLGQHLSIEPEGQNLNVVVILESDPIRNAVEYEAAHSDKPACWRKLFGDIEVLSDRPDFLTLPVAMESHHSPLDVSGIQSIRWCDWTDSDEEARIVRLLIRTIDNIRTRLSDRRSNAPREKIFVSHAKKDASNAARKVSAHIMKPELQLEAFYDVRNLNSGARWRQQLASGVSEGMLLALVSDEYFSRDWCCQEMEWAKRHRCPIVGIFIAKERIPQTSPIGGNIPLMTSAITDEDYSKVQLSAEEVSNLEKFEARAIESALLELLAEALRCDVFRLRAKADNFADDAILPRPPELLDLAFAAEPGAPVCYVYPDPPLAKRDLDNLRKLRPDLVFRTLEEAAI